jgi:serine/threonine protein kinase
MDIVEGKVTYERLNRIGVGEGANSEVWEAREINMNRVVAVKEISKADLSVRGVYDYFREAKAMFEARHPHVVPIYTATDQKEFVALVMPLYPGKSLASRITAGPLPLSRALHIAQGTLEGLSHIHVKGFLHFDIKPSNVLFAPGELPMLADFGQARMLDSFGVADAPDMYKHLPAPETLSTGRATVASDIFQMGLLLYRAINGNPFYQTVKAAQIAKHGLPECLKTARIVDSSTFLPHVPRRMRSVIQKALSPLPRDRYSTAPELADALALVAPVRDWVVKIDADRIEWRGTRNGRADVLVSREQNAARLDRWDVRSHTAGAGGARALRKADFWAAGLTPNQANQHLQKVFRALERE